MYLYLHFIFGLAITYNHIKGLGGLLHLLELQLRHLGYESFRVEVQVEFCQLGSVSRLKATG